MNHTYLYLNVNTVSVQDPTNRTYFNIVRLGKIVKRKILSGFKGKYFLTKPTNLELFDKMYMQINNLLLASVFPEAACFTCSSVLPKDTDFLNGISCVLFLMERLR